MEKMTTGEFGKRFGLESLQANLVVGFLKGLKIIKECGKQENAPGQKGRSPVLYSFPSVISIRVKGKAKKSKPKAKKTVAPVAAPVAPVAPVSAPVTA